MTTQELGGVWCAAGDVGMGTVAHAEAGSQQLYYMYMHFRGETEIRQIV